PGLRPLNARELLASTWQQEPPEDRAAFLASLEVGLSMDDEPFLESTLDDRRQTVRQKAAELLARLPDSRLVGRMIERLTPLLTVPAGQSGLWPSLRRQRSLHLAVGLPEACDEAMVRDGVDPRPHAQHGERAGWLVQMLAIVPPSTWCRTWDATPAEIVE